MLTTSTAARTLAPMLLLALSVLLWLSFNSLLGLLVAAFGARPHRWEGAWVWRVREGSLLDHLYAGWRFPIAAQTFGLLVLLAPGADRPHVLTHERVHVRQQLLWGPAFWVAYLGSWLWLLVKLRSVEAAYRAIPFEVAAYAAEGRPS